MSSAKGKKIGYLLLRSRMISLSADVQETFLGVKREGATPHNKCGHAPIGLCMGSILAKCCTLILGRIQGPVRCEERNKILLPK